MNLKLLLSTLLFSTLLSGCVLPIPSVSPKRGNALKPSDVSFIKIGHTTRTETIERLGSSYREMHGKSALAYSWEVRGYSVDWWGGFMYWLDEPLGTTGSKSWRAMFVEFDDNYTVKRVEWMRLSSRKSLDQQLEEWAATSRRKSPPAASKPSKPSANTP